jgi:methionyl-tRNA formyltransferase
MTVVFPSATPPLRIIVAAEGVMGLSVLQSLVQNHDVKLVGLLRWSQTKQGKGFNTIEDKAMALLAKQHHITDIKVHGINDPVFLKKLPLLHPHVLLIASWGQLIKSPLLDWPGLLILNIHPSLLPAYRGANPYKAVIIDQQAHTGLSLHRVTSSVDAGPLLSQCKVIILPTDTGGSLQTRCAQHIDYLLAPVIPQLIAVNTQWDQLPWHAQVPDDPSTSQTKPISLLDGALDWSLPPQTLAIKTRAIQPWLTAYTVATTAIGPLLLAFTNLTLLPSNTPGNSGAKPTYGQVLGWKHKTLLVASSQADITLGLQAVRVYWLVGYLPVGLSRLVLKAVLRGPILLAPPA